MQEVGTSKPLHLPSPTPFRLWAVCYPPPALFGCMAFLCLVKPTAWSDGACSCLSSLKMCKMFFRAINGPPPPTVSPSRCMTFKQGEKLILSSHLQVCRANSSVPPTAEEKGCRKLVKIPFAGGGILIFHPACPHRPVHDGSAHWRPPVLLHVSECCELIRAGPGSLIQNTFKAARSYSAPVSLELTVIFQTSTSSRAL